MKTKRTPFRPSAKKDGAGNLPEIGVDRSTGRRGRGASVTEVEPEVDAAAKPAPKAAPKAAKAAAAQRMKSFSGPSDSHTFSVIFLALGFLSSP